MKTIKRFFLLAFSTLIFGNVHTVNAQVTIGGETEPVKGTTLDLSPADGYRGAFKLPQVRLTDYTSIPSGDTGFTEASDINPNDLIGSIVYNTNAALGAGLYMWSGTEWTLVVADLLNTKQNFMNTLYPIGSIYMTTGTENPANTIGGTWVRWGEGRVPVGVATSGTFNSVEKIGGAEMHTLTLAQLPNVTGQLNIYWGSTGSRLTGGSGVFSSSSIVAGKYDTGSTQTAGGNSHGSIVFSLGGGGQAHNNLQPYITCYMWKRTS